MTWNSPLREQLTWLRDHRLRARLDGLTDDEYFREPVPGCWNLRPQGAGHLSEVSLLRDLYLHTRREAS
ncbi:hypothetical protein [Actinomadura sp. WAC 06369]|uniref:hypothetical protein n=1 Tax=Actinomadura sp. WAC 06369 TaxID=2203193 RepID=UPI000F76B235|nr:hypothetical protein [Actinomadura sp. WAC 06369]RSN53378.1 hypothetical protein DMH08_27560 [Actinomadura sp. WAC 06369]